MSETTVDSHDEPQAPKTSMMGYLFAGVLVLIGVAIDQVTKQLAHAKLQHAGFVNVIDGYFALTYSRNTGAFFSLGSDWSPLLRRGFFITVTVIAVGMIANFYRQTPSTQRVLRAALLLFLAGAIGNLIDRVLFGEVIDFLHLHIRDAFHWATFNVADIYITIGLGLLVMDAFKKKKE